MIQYNYTRDMYSLDYAWPAWIIEPDNGDPLTAASANIFEKSLNDRNNFVLEALCKLSVSNFNYKVASVDGLTLKVHPFIAQTALAGTYYNTVTSSELSASVANLEGGGSFAANTWYYLYHRVSAGPVFSLVISTGVPHKFLLYKDNAGAQDLSYKYICSFRTNGAGSIISFFKSDGYTTYLQSGKLLVNGTSTTGDTISCTSFLPPHAARIMLIFRFRNYSSTAVNQVAIFNGQGQFIPIINVGKETTAYDSVQLSAQMPVVVNDPMQYIFYQITDISTPLTTLNIDVTGYWE